MSEDNNSNSSTGGVTSGTCQTGGWSTSGLVKPCDSCPSDAVPTTDGTFCACTDATKYFNPASGVCETNPCTGSVSGQWPFNGVCTTCPSGSTINASNTGCTCATGSFSYSLNQCVNINNCTGNQWDYNGVCEDCPSGSTAHTNHSSCLCSTGTFNAASNTCVIGS